MILEFMLKCIVLVLFLHSLLLMMVTDCLFVVTAITIIIVEEKRGDSYIVVKIAMRKVMTALACNVLKRMSVVSSDTGGSSGSSGSITMDTGISSGCGVSLLSLTSGS